MWQIAIRCCCVWLLLPWASHALSNSNIDLTDVEYAIVGQSTRYFQEDNEPLSLQQAMLAFERTDLSNGRSQSIALGIGTRPVWLSFRVYNPYSESKRMRLAIDTPWLDFIDTWLVKNDQAYAHIRGGDHLPFHQRPMQYRVYAFEQDFVPGETQVYLRVETTGPMAIPIVLSTPRAAVKQDIANGYRYGLLYGIMFALAVYNLVLYVIIKHREFGLYSLYLFGFILNSLSYTGQLHVIITADFGVHFQDWLDNFLMITYSVAGLHFARTLLKTNEYAPRLDTLIRHITLFIPIGIFIGALANQLVFSLILAFILNSSFAVLFIIMGIKARAAGVPSAGLFLFSSVTAAVCIGISTMAVAGIVPYNTFTFSLIEAGMTFEAMMLSVILAKIFRVTKRELVVAEQVARTDPLTGLYNRRGFEELASNAFELSVSMQRSVSVALIDIDLFKQVNDRFGHAAGDEVIKQVAQKLQQSARKGDLVARWGGEEFVMLLPDTNPLEGEVHAQRMRKTLEKLQIEHGETTCMVTVSIGVAGTNSTLARDAFNLEALIRQADNMLYRAKVSGRNCVYATDANLALAE